MTMPRAFLIKNRHDQLQGGVQCDVTGALDLSLGGLQDRLDNFNNNLLKQQEAQRYHGDGKLSDYEPLGVEVKVEEKLDDTLEIDVETPDVDEQYSDAAGTGSLSRWSPEEEFRPDVFTGAAAAPGSPERPRDDRPAPAPALPRASLSPCGGSPRACFPELTSPPPRDHSPAGLQNFAAHARCPETQPDTRAANIWNPFLSPSPSGKHDSNAYLAAFHLRMQQLGHLGHMTDSRDVKPFFFPPFGLLPPLPGPVYPQPPYAPYSTRLPHQTSPPRAELPGLDKVTLDPRHQAAQLGRRNSSDGGLLYIPSWGGPGQEPTQPHQTMLPQHPYKDIHGVTSSAVPPSTVPVPAPGHPLLDSSAVRRKDGEPPRYICDGCNKSYSTFSGLSKHKQFHCVTQVKKSFSCKFCEKTYVSLGALKMHIRTHTLPCKCTLCGKAFSRPWLLQGHLRTHTGEKPFRCAHCARAFADRSNLRAHLQTHSDVKKYSCSSCTKTFSRMSLLVKHQDGGCPGLRR